MTHPLLGPAAGLQFPLAWQGKVLARADAAELPTRLEQTLRALGLQPQGITAGNTSAGGRYVTYTVQVVIPDRLTLQQVAYALAQLDGVRHVL